MPFQSLWAFERGALWAMDLDGALPAAARSHTAATFSEAAPGAEEALAAAMGLAGSRAVQRRFAAGSRCFVARIEGAITGYGWVSQGEEQIGELERVLRMRPGEAYIWDCATLEPFRRQGIYSGLLAHIAATLRREGLQRLWIGASLGNRPSLRGFASAGFQPVITILYIRLLRVSHSWLVGAASAPPALVADARRALVASHDTRAGQPMTDHARERGSLHHG